MFDIPFNTQSMNADREATNVLSRNQWSFSEYFSQIFEFDSRKCSTKIVSLTQVESRLEFFSKYLILLNTCLKCLTQHPK